MVKIATGKTWARPHFRERMLCWFGHVQPEQYVIYLFMEGSGHGGPRWPGRIWWRPTAFNGSFTTVDYNETVLLCIQNICLLYCIVLLFRLLGKKIIVILRSKILLNWTYDHHFLLEKINLTSKVLNQEEMTTRQVKSNPSIPVGSLWLFACWVVFHAFVVVCPLVQT